MIATALEMPVRSAKPRTAGITSVIDGGLPTGLFTDVVRSGSEYIDLVKFGWGTAAVTNDLEVKLDVLAELGIDHYFGGSFFEKHILQDRFEDFRTFCRDHRCRFVEVSNGVIDLSNTEKAGYIAKLADEFTVISEVGYKDAQRSEQLPPSQWIAAIWEDLDAGAWLVTTEARESGHSGICRPNGDLRVGLIEELLACGLDADRLLFEAPTSDLQTYFVRRVGTQVNLANIPAMGVLALETLRLGLRGDTLTAFDHRDEDAGAGWR
jgi:phosphosulfolactate synthase